MSVSNGYNILTVRNTALRSSQYNGKPVLRAAENATEASSDPILVSRTQDGWAPVEKLEGSVGRDELGANFALWKDEPEFSWGGLKKVNDGDGKIQPNEVQTFGPAYERGRRPLKEGNEDSRKRTFCSTMGYVGGEIVSGPKGAEIREVAYLAVADYPSHNNYIGHATRSSDTHWLIND
jgi:hypothetical protein